MFRPGVLRPYAERDVAKHRQKTFDLPPYLYPVAKDKHSVLVHSNVSMQ